jgi:hypothetical protein
MHYQHEFRHNLDFKWYETSIVIHKETVQLFIPDEVYHDFLANHWHLVKIMQWIDKERDLLGRLCFDCLWGFATASYKPSEIQLLSISLEKAGRFELLWKGNSQGSFVVLKINETFEIEHHEIQ